MKTKYKKTNNIYRNLDTSEITVNSVRKWAQSMVTETLIPQGLVLNQQTDS